MTRWHALILFVFISQASFGQNHICLGADLTEIIRNGNAGLRLGCSISEQWSAEAASSFHLTCIRQGLQRPVTSRSVSCELSFRHWVRKCYNGAYFSFGLFNGFRKEADMTFSMGYSLPVLECIRLDIGYRLMILDTIKYRRGESGELRLELDYIF